MKIKTLFIDDDIYSVRPYVEELADNGFDVSISQTSDEAIKLAKKEIFDIVIADIMMPSGDTFDHIETAGGYRTGLAICRKIREYLPEALFVAFSLSRDPQILEWFSQDDKCLFLYKGIELPNTFLDKIKQHIRQVKDLPNIFIVHGHDTNLVLELKNYLQNTLKLGEPIVLAEKASKGKTIIEKFEYYAKETDLVFALFTPDDTLDNGQKQARPNVIFEIGYFLGILGRHKGKVFLLHKSPTNIPSDLMGIIYIDITNGIMNVGELIRNELTDLF